MKLLVCVTFHYVESRLEFLKATASNLSELAEDVKVVIVTNTSEAEELENIRNIISVYDYEYEIFVPNGIGHPLLLPWSHFSIVRKSICTDRFTHYMCLEDDIEIKRNNMDYWIEGREFLRPSGCYPSFIRVEYSKGKDQPLSTDTAHPMDLKKMPKVIVRDGAYCFVNSLFPYQGMYLYDKELMTEYLGSIAFSPDYYPKNTPHYFIREKAVLALTFFNVPLGFVTRNLLGYDLNSSCIDSNAFIHHMPNNYANNPDFHKLLPVDSVFKNHPNS